MMVPVRPDQVKAKVDDLVVHLKKVKPKQNGLIIEDVDESYASEEEEFMDYEPEEGILTLG